MLDQNTRLLSSLPKGTAAQVSRLNFEQAIQHRFLTMGIEVGELISVVRSSMAKSPLMVRINGAYFMIRQQDAQQIEVSPLL